MISNLYNEIGQLKKENIKNKKVIEELQKDNENQKKINKELIDKINKLVDNIRELNNDY